MREWISTAADVVTAGAAVWALIYARKAWNTSVETLRASYRPLIRPVPLVFRDRGLLNSSVLLVKNYGRGPAVGPLLFEAPTGPDSQPIASADIVEPLGDALGPVPDETTRIGRLRIPLKDGAELRSKRRYRIIYQDMAGAWHETDLTIDGLAFTATFMGQLSAADVKALPTAALDGARAVRQSEDV